MSEMSRLVERVLEGDVQAALALSDALVALGGSTKFLNGTLLQVTAPGYKRRGEVFAPKPEIAQFAFVVEGKSVELFGVKYPDSPKPQPYARRFEIGDSAEFDSYNLSYYGSIVSISTKRVVVERRSTFGDRGNRSLTLCTFSWRNWDFDEAKTAAANSETMRYI